MLELLFIAKIGLPFADVVDQRSYSAIERQQNFQADIGMARAVVDFLKVVKPEKLSHLVEARRDVLQFLLLELEFLLLGFKAKEFPLGHAASDAVVNVMGMTNGVGNALDEALD